MRELLWRGVDGLEIHRLLSIAVSKNHARTSLARGRRRRPARLRPAPPRWVRRTQLLTRVLLTNASDRIFEGKEDSEGCIRRHCGSR